MCCREFVEGVSLREGVNTESTEDTESTEKNDELSNYMNVCFG